MFPKSMFSISSISSILNISGFLGTQTLSHSHFERQVPGKKTRAVTFMLLFADILLCGGEFALHGSLKEIMTWLGAVMRYEHIIRVAG